MLVAIVGGKLDAVIIDAAPDIAGLAQPVLTVMLVENRADIFRHGFVALLVHRDLEGRSAEAVIVRSFDLVLRRVPELQRGDDLPRDQSAVDGVGGKRLRQVRDRKSTRLNSSHVKT